MIVPAVLLVIVTVPLVTPVRLVTRPETSSVSAAAPAVFVSAKFAGVATPLTVAATVYPPDTLFAVAARLASPEAFVTAVPTTGFVLAPLAGPVKVTVIPLNGLLPLSRTNATSELANAVPTVADWPLPVLTVTDAAAPAVFVSAKFAGVATPLTVAATVYAPPAVEFAVKFAATIPEALVATVIVAVELLKVPEAPDPGAVNVTFTPDTGRLAASFTVTDRAVAKAVPTVADCGDVPAFADTEPGT